MQTKELSDLGLIVGLITKGYEPIETIQRGNRVFFIFEWDENMQDLEDGYFNSQGFDVDAQTYHHNIKEVRRQYFGWR